MGEIWPKKCEQGGERRDHLWYDDFGMRAIFIDDARSLSLKIPGLVEWPKVEPTGRSLRPGMCPA